MGWEALRGDPLPWLLDDERPNLQWRTLTELVGRPAASPAVARARGGANAVDPVAALLEALHPDGSWACGAAWWDAGVGPGWRLLSAVQWGADPGDPRLQAAAAKLLEKAPGEGGFARGDSQSATPRLTARVVQAMAGLGLARLPRVQEALAWLEEGARPAPDGGWLAEDPDGPASPCGVTAVATLAALTASGDDRRNFLRERAVRGTLELLARGGADLELLSQPCLERTDLAEALWALARAGVALQPAMAQPLARLQARQLEGGRWPRDLEPPSGLPIGDPPVCGAPSRWVTLKAAVALLRYGEEAELPRMFPEKPE